MIADRKVAPAEVRVAGLSVTVATPRELVNAVAAGVRVAKAGSVLNVTTVPGTAEPAASSTVAVTVAGALLEMEVTGDPPLLMAIVMLGAGARVVVVVVATVVAEEPPAPAVPLPLPQPVSIANIAASSNAEKFVIFWLKKVFCTRASLVFALCAQ